ncbi:hypothetical protein [Ascidiimonas aurantiaca]|uniref:hypothetical protein n=1 Tax=Ascidiimonas aurantiaca TaxID=1685432 RepID=UPI0030EE57F8
MKKISNISGSKKLNRQALKNIKGGTQCYEESGICCQELRDGTFRCAPGQCTGRFCTLIPA